MTFIQLDGDSLSLTRFALSPLAEILATVGEAYRKRSSEWGWLWRDPMADGLFSLLSQTKYLPDFVALPPAGMETKIEDELAQMASFDDAHARRTLAEARARSWDAHDPVWMKGEQITARAAEAFLRAWRQIAPDWPRRRAVMERDIRHRAGLIATGGWQLALSGISPKVRWVDANRIQFSHQAQAGPTITRDGLTLVPHTTGPGRWICEAPPRFAMVYPARGTLAPSPARGGVAELLGSTRSDIIRLVKQPTTPSELSILLSKSLGTVSGHLRALEHTGVIDKVRNGRTVSYSLTATGEQLRDLLGVPGADSRGSR